MEHKRIFDLVTLINLYRAYFKEAFYKVDRVKHNDYYIRELIHKTNAERIAFDIEQFYKANYISHDLKGRIGMYAFRKA